MAPNERTRLNSEREKTEDKTKTICFHCKKTVETAEICVKCSENFHPSCLRQAAGKKNAVCVHQPATINSVIEVPKDTEIAYLKKIVQELEDKNRLLEENTKLWKEKATLMEKQLKTYENDKKKEGKQSLPPPPIPQSARSVIVTEAEIVPVLPTDGARHISTDDPVPTMDANSVATIDANPVATSVNKPHEGRHQLTNEEDTVLGTPNGKEEEDWIVVRRDKNNRNNKQRNLGKNNRPTPLRGSNENSSILKVAKKMSFLFISGLAPETESHCLIEHLKGLNLHQDCICEKMKTTRGKMYSSFKLGVPLEKKDQFMSTAVWPKNVVVNHFSNLQRQSMVKNSVPKNFQRSQRHQ